MRRQDLESLVKRIASPQSEGSLDYIDAMNALVYIMVNTSLRYSDLASIFENKLGSKEKYRFFNIFSESEENAIYFGQAHEFHCLKKHLKASYLYFFKRAFKKNTIVSLLPGIAIVSLIWLLPGGILKATAPVLICLVYLFHFLKKFTDLATEQNDIIIRELKNKEIEKFSKKLESILLKEKWIKKDSE